jgi:hypothetical protein
LQKDLTEIQDQRQAYRDSLAVILRSNWALS